jgi:nitric oxide synthase oxygenase domain/subunit
MAAITKAIDLTIITGNEGESAHIENNTPTLPVQNGSIRAVDGSVIENSGDFVPQMLKGVSHDSSIPPQCLAGMKIYAEAQQEFERIRKAHRTLAPTGCTPEFCQSGRATHINEPRVGRDRPLAEVQQEAIDFLRECRDYNVIPSDGEVDKRIKEALVQISHTAIVTAVTDHNGNQSTGLAGGMWHQEPAELEYGLRAAWRNARRCIMRSEHENLALCDLRQVQSSPEMARTIVKGVTAAFNRGHILPTVFVFPPRQPGKRGPMIWNSQILAFAGYRQNDGSILGDPLNVELTDSIIELGWTPPVKKSRWDILPIVTMAEGDAPYLMELPIELKRTVQISHPRYEQQFRQLDLRWVVAPALSRFGFDIGGNQYTATPFIGWFMDAEIGVRNLADSFRYNVLPDIVKALQLTDESDREFDDQPEYMRMLALVRLMDILSSDTELITN